MKFTFTCNDSIKAMVREDITITADSFDEAWDKAIARFARKYKTPKGFVCITAVKWGE